jgi:two-component system chemotaxis response regulator CheY
MDRSSLRILIVDDMPAMRSILRNMLEELGYMHVTEAEDGQEAWDLVREAARAGRETAYHIVISDWNMPGLSGVELLRSIRSTTECGKVAFFMVTAVGDRAHIAEARNAGATDYVVKPFEPGDLAGKLSQVTVF